MDKTTIVADRGSEGKIGIASDSWDGEKARSGVGAE